MSGSYSLEGSFLEKCGNSWENGLVDMAGMGNIARSDMAGLGSIGLKTKPKHHDNQAQNTNNCQVV